MGEPKRSEPMSHVQVKIATNGAVRPLIYHCSSALQYCSITFSHRSAMFFRLGRCASLALRFLSLSLASCIRSTLATAASALQGTLSASTIPPQQLAFAQKIGVNLFVCSVQLDSVSVEWF
jgi:hypothetical protein